MDLKLNAFFRNQYNELWTIIDSMKNETFKVGK